MNSEKMAIGKATPFRRSWKKKNKKEKLNEMTKGKVYENTTCKTTPDCEQWYNVKNLKNNSQNLVKKNDMSVIHP